MLEKIVLVSLQSPTEPNFPQLILAVQSTHHIMCMYSPAVTRWSIQKPQAASQLCILFVNFLCQEH